MENIDAQKLLIFATVYALLFSTLYLLGFWMTFNINPFHFINTSDVIKISVLPMIITFLIGIFAIGLGRLLAVATTLKKECLVSQDEEKPKRSSALFICRSIQIFIIVSLLFFTILVDTSVFWLLLLNIIMMIAIEVVGKLFYEKPFKMTVSCIAIFMISFSYTYGNSSAKSIKSSSEHILINDENKGLTYIGLMGDYIFLWNEKLKVVDVIRRESIDKIQFPVSESKPLISLNWVELSSIFKMEN
ncbi:hypothetical protein [Aeromonas dhakensis]|uniref:hypothetical protein n=1 Tax=Aeromonas dhakensis TaxID=196024 RepID=UPI001CF04CFF|nr:hypothetical protein [Aeromonas dhakensis]UCM45554.1 hypothetical protein LEO73_01790 [Aeromonas dhakensis]